MDKYIVRQAIKEPLNDEVVGYEILIQSDNDSLYNGSEHIIADAIAGFLTQNNDVIFRDKMTFLSFPPTLFFRNTPKMFDKEKLIIQIDDSVVVHPLTPSVMKKYRKDGYRFAINNFQYSPKYLSLLEMVDYVKVDVTGIKDAKGRLSLANLIEMMHSFEKKCIAVGVSTKEEYDLVKLMKVDFLEGNYIETAMMTKSSKMDYLEGNFFQLVVEVSKDEPDVEAIETIISRDAALSYSILKMVNSAYFAQRKKTSSIRQALVTLGLSQLRQWVYLLSIKDDERNATSDEVLKLSFLRATFLSALVELLHTNEIIRSEAYLIGMFSTMEYIIDAPLEELLEDIPIPDVARDALVDHTGIGGDLFEMVLCYEQADWRKLKQYTAEFQIPANAIAQIYMNSVEEVNEIWDSLSSDFERPEGEEKENNEENQEENIPAN